MAKIPVEERKLNTEQQAAVEFGDGPFLIIAGAGTGKTTVVTERIKYLIASDRAKPSEILALTFTEKAAREMGTRVDVIMPYGYTQMWISTFHSFCDRILRNEAIHIGLNPAYRLMSDTDATMLVRKHLFSFDLDYFRPLGNPTKFIAGMLQHFSRLKDEDVSPSQYVDWVNSKYQNPKSKQISKSLPRRQAGKIQMNDETIIDAKKYIELAGAYKFYEELKIKEGVMDFSDLIASTLLLFRTRKNILKEYQEKFKYILVDEFQDTNVAQNELVMLLAGVKQNITAVADDDQSIYKFRGAAVSNVIAFRKHYPKTHLIVLSQNYRSTQTILDHSYRLIQYNNPDRLEVKENINKKLSSVRNIVGQPVQFIHTDRVENEADEVAKMINRLGSGLDHKRPDPVQYRWKDFAILLRANSHAEPFVRALSRHSIQYQFLGPGQLFRQPEVKDLIAYLQVLHNIEDNVALFRVLSHPFFDLSPRDLAAISAFAKRQNVSILEACEVLSGSGEAKGSVSRPFVSDKTKSMVAKIVEMIHRHLGLLTKETAGQLLYYFLQDSGMLKSILEYTIPMDERKAANISKFFNKLKTYEIDHEDASVPVLLDWILLSMEMGESPIAADTDWTENDAVNLLTIHSAKGLEFPVVFLVNLVSERFPTRERREQIPIPDALIKEELPVGDFHLQEERRLFYVGMTRARDHLYISAADFYGEGKREKKLSPFIYDALGEDIAAVSNSKTSQMSLLDWQKVPEPTISIISKKTSVTYLSYSQIDTFRLCPLHYKLRYLMGVPTPPSAALSFGSSIHSALKFFYQSVQKGDKPTKQELLSLLSSHWLHEGYGSKRYEQEMIARGETYLTSFFEKEYNPQVTPVLLEQPFTVPIRSGDRMIKIGGRIDRIDQLPDGRLEIIDYKTGKVPAKREIDTNLQLSMYAIAASEMRESPFGKKPEDIVLTMYFLDAQDKEDAAYRLSTVRTTEQLKGEKDTIFSIASEIENSDFRCRGHQICTSCEFQMFCGVYQ